MSAAQKNNFWNVRMAGFVYGPKDVNHQDK